MRVLFDTNVILDVMLLREPFHKYSALLLAKVERKEIEGFLCPTTITTIFYLAQKTKGSQETQKIIEALLRIFEISSVNKFILKSALKSDFSDYEDAVLHESAIESNVDIIVTRNVKDFSHAKLIVLAPEELLTLLIASKKNS